MPCIFAGSGDRVAAWASASLMMCTCWLSGCPMSSLPSITWSSGSPSLIGLPPAFVHACRALAPSSWRLRSAASVFAFSAFVGPAALRTSAAWRPALSSLPVAW